MWLARPRRGCIILIGGAPRPPPPSLSNQPETGFSHTVCYADVYATEKAITATKSSLFSEQLQCNNATTKPMSSKLV